MSNAFHRILLLVLSAVLLDVPLRAADVPDFLAFAASLGFEGASVTIPFKLDALRLASRAPERTEMVGAANTLRFHDGAWEATNTDIESGPFAAS